MIRRIVLFLRLPAFEQLLLCRVVYFLLHYRIAIRFCTLQSVLNKSKAKIVNDCGSAGRVTPETIVRLVSAGALLVSHSNCFSKALTAQRFFSAFGYRSKLHIGVAKNAEGPKAIKGHAWLSRDGAVVLGQLADLDAYREVLVIDQGNVN